MGHIIKNLNVETLPQKMMDQLVELFLTTGYYEYPLLGNSLGLDIRKMIAEHYILPDLLYLNIVLDDLQNVAGFYLGAEKGKLG